ncbi:hypothetical protein DFS34DRAFT_599199 [Phlyctochytrium arcticum]|nr:hypothetical protein DFS34DRAFT_599199 [Phlyctochytrium arcticum]
MDANVFHALIVAASSALFLYWSNDVTAPWVRALFLAEAAVQAVLAISGVYNRSRRHATGFSYVQHHSSYLTMLLAVLSGALTNLRICELADAQYMDNRAVAMLATGIFYRHFSPENNFKMILIVNTLWALQKQSPSVTMYTVNCLGGYLLQGKVPGWVAELFNIGVWWSMKKEFGL